MLNQSETLDRAFHALSDPTRRAMLDQLTQGPATVSNLARPFESTLASIVQHIQVLEGSGLIVTAKVGRTRTCRVSSEAMAGVEHWLSERRRVWEGRFDRLGALLETSVLPAPELASSADTVPKNTASKNSASRNSAATNTRRSR